MQQETGYEETERLHTPAERRRQRWTPGLVTSPRIRSWREDCEADPNTVNNEEPWIELSLRSEEACFNSLAADSACIPNDVKGSGSYTEGYSTAVLFQEGSCGSALSCLRSKFVKVCISLKELRGWQTSNTTKA